MNFRKTTAMLAALGAMLCIGAQTRAALVTAGELIVDLRGADLVPGATNWMNHADSTNSVGDFMQLDQGMLNVVPVVGDGTNYAKALNVDGLLGNSVVSALATPAVLESNSTRSVEAWIYAAGLPNESTVVGWGNSGNQMMCSFRYHNGGNGMFSGWYADAGWTGTLPVGYWTYVVWTFDGAQASGYINGMPAGTSSIGTLLTSHNKLCIGSGRDGGNGPFDGYIADVRVHTGVLSDTDIANNYAEGIIDPPTSLEPVIDGLNDVSAYAGQNVTLDPQVTGGVPIFLQWQSNGVSLAAATNSTLVLTNVQVAASGSVYSLIASNAFGMATNSMTLTVEALPMLGPVTINFDVNRGAGTYEGTAIAGGTGTRWNGWGDSTLGAGPYSVNNVLDSHGNVLSSVQIVVDGATCRSWSVTDPSAGNPNPLLLMQDYIWEGMHTISISGLSAGDYDLYVYAHGDVGGQYSTVTLDEDNGGEMASTSDLEEYRNIFQTNALDNSYIVLPCTVAEGASTVVFTSQYLNGFQLQSSIPIIEGLEDMTVDVGTNLVINPGVTGRNPSYQWSYNGSVISTDPELTLNDVQSGQSGEYLLEVSNSLGSDSKSFVLSVEGGGPITIDAVSVAGGKASISWTSGAGAGYSIESSPSLQSPSWTAVTNVDSVGTQTTDVPVSGNDAEFFRISK